MSREFGTLLRQWGLSQGFSRHAHTNAWYKYAALRQFITDARFGWLCSDTTSNGDPADKRGHMRHTILTELGRMQDTAVREKLALHLCATQPTTREAVALIRAYRLGRHPQGTALQLSTILVHALQAYLFAHPAMEWKEVRQALAGLEQVVERASAEESH
jgi:hypothetical protein